MSSTKTKKKKKPAEPHGFDSGKLRALMAERKMSRDTLAEKVEKSPTTISLWCHDRSKPGWDDLWSLGQAFGVDWKIFLK